MERAKPANEVTTDSNPQPEFGSVPSANLGRGGLQDSMVAFGYKLFEVLIRKTGTGNSRDAHFLDTNLHGLVDQSEARNS